MNVIIIFAPVHYNFDSMGMSGMPPMALYYLSSVLKEKGHNVKAIDPSYFKKRGFFLSQEGDENIVLNLFKDKIDAVLLSSNTGNWGISLCIINIIKKHFPKLPVIVGGVHPSYFDEHILKTTSTDYVIRGEGELVLPALLEALGDEEKIKSIPGVSFKGVNGEIIRNINSQLISTEKLEKSPSPAYDMIPKGVYNNLVIETSRGCRFSCIFCSVVHRNRWRGFDEKVVIDKVIKAAPYVKSGIVRSNIVYFVDDCFTANTQRALNILNEIDKLELGLTFFIEARVTDLLTPGFIDKLPKHLISGIQIGVECGYNEGLRNVRKGVTVEQLEECVKLLYKSGLNKKAFLSFIVGFPWEKCEDMIKTIDMAGYLGEKYSMPSNINWLWILPSDLWNIKERYGIEIHESEFDNPLWVRSKNLFYKAHPNVTHEILETINKRYDCFSMECKQIVRYNVPYDYE